ncbi:MAG: TonB-dependent receptor [Chitinophagaceae bacterium]|nr:TonB-dependent receptor [Chitinophagaceae bacterium]
MKQIILSALAMLIVSFSIAQKTIPDSTQTLEEVTVTAFEQQRSIAAGGIVKVLSNSQADRYNKSSLVNGLNAVAGVRMEERSPGSYRLNIRGSSLRSPFGVRNIKIYWNNIPITDPGGNTYFNQFAFNNFSSIEIFKGPAGSMYGAGTGGLMLMKSLGNNWKAGADLEYIAGSYGLQNIFASANFGDENNQNRITYAHNQSDGYRDNTKMRRDNASWSSKINISGKQQLEAHVLFTDMYYQTPGGLNAAEFTANPKQARPAAGGFPSAQQAKATIYQKNFLAGIGHHYELSEHFRNTTTLYGAFAQIQNPTFRNYERRTEPHFGGRSSFVFDKSWNSVKWQLVAGGELQQGYFNTQVSKNKNGNPDTLQTNDDVKFSVYSIFVHSDLELKDGWIITAGASINKSSIDFTRLSNYPTTKQSRTYQNEISPRVAISKSFGEDITVFASVARGFSPPTIAELLPSTGVISTFLEAEDGINYEAGAQLRLFKKQLRIEVAAFHFKLNNALVVRKDISNADYYVNAGDAQQQGIELNIDYLKSFGGSFIQQLIIRTAQSLNDFEYGSFQKDATDFSGKKLPGVPDYTASLQVDLQFRVGAYVNSTFYRSGSIYVNDANTVEVDAYNLLGARVGWKFNLNPKFAINIYAGGDNLLDEVYSLGNDINAAGGRYYNVAASANWYAGLALQFLK